MSGLRQFTEKYCYVVMSAEAVKCKTYLIRGLVKHSCTSFVCVCFCVRVCVYFGGASCEASTGGSCCTGVWGGRDSFAGVHSLPQ